jgi:EAL domain-containing protein (putative c-di-GMP-specific phosphodiesterase class I)
MLNDGQQVFEGYAAGFRGLVPELMQLSIHDATGQAVWMSADYLRPEDHALVFEALQEFSTGSFERDYVVRDDARILATLNLPGPRSASQGVVLLELASVPRDGWPLRRLGERVEVLLNCLGVELARRAPLVEIDPSTAVTVEVPALPAGDPAVLADLEAALAEAALADATEGAARTASFELFLQPILPLRSELELLRFEVLLRLRREDAVVLAPGVFLPVAARHALLPQIDRWVVRTLLGWLMNHRKRWFRIPSVFAINLSGASLTQPGFVEFVESSVVQSSVPPQALCFEIAVESALRCGPDLAAAARRLEALGCTVAIDNFGRGDLSYGYLRGCPAQYLKIDRSLVGSAHRDRIAGAVVSGIVRMAEALGAKTVAEAIESADELATMRALGVDFAQGFLLGQPAALQGIDFAAVRSYAIAQLATPRN